MQRHFDQELGQLKEKLLTMASHSEGALTKAIKALVDRDDEMARSVKESDTIIDQLEKEMREAAANLEFELAARLRDEVKKLRDVEIGIGVEAVMGPAD